MAASASFGIGPFRRIRELGIRHRYEIGTVGDIEIAVRSVRDVTVIKPDVVGIADDGHRIRSAAAISRAVRAVVPDDLHVANDNVARAAQT